MIRLQAAWDEEAAAMRAVRTARLAMARRAGTGRIAGTVLLGMIAGGILLPALCAALTGTPA